MRTLKTAWHTTMQSTLQTTGIIAGASVLFYLLRFLPPHGADGYFISQLLETHSFPIYYRSILTVWIHKLFYAALYPLGWSGWDAMAVSSCAAGGVAVWGLLNITKNPVFLVINITSGSFLVFYGHVENYAWVNAFLILSYAYFFQWTTNGKYLPAAVSLYMLACLSHMLALFYLPAVIYLLWKKREYHHLEWLLPVLGFVFVVLGLSAFFPLLGTDNGMERLVPLFEVWAPNQYFTFFSLEHGKMLSYFYYRSSFLEVFPVPGTEWYFGFPMALPVLYILRGRIDSLFLRFMLIHCICGWVWTSFWHPDWGYSDWDLFSQFAIPLHILVGLLITDVTHSL